MKAWKVFCLVVLACCSCGQAIAQTYKGTNAPGAFTDFNINLGASSTNISITVDATNGAYSYLLLKKGATPSNSSYDFIALANGQTNAINLEAPEFTATNYVVRVSTPASSTTHAFTLTVATNVTNLRSAARPATKSLIALTDGIVASNGSNFFRVDVPSNLPPWRIVLYSTNAVNPDLYIQTNAIPTTAAFWKRSLAQNPDTLVFTNNEAGVGACFVGVLMPATTNNVRYTLALEFFNTVTLTWDPGTTHLGTQVYSTQSVTGGDYFFRVVPQNTALGAWRTALNVISGEANVYLLRGALPTPATATYKSERGGSDGFVVPAGNFTAGEEWFIMVRASPGSQWNLVTGEPFVLDLGAVAPGASSGSGDVPMGAEGMRFFKTTVPLNTLGWRLWLNGQTNTVLVKKAGVPVAGASDLSQVGQMLVVPSYLVGGQLYFVGISGSPGATINLDSRQHSATDISFDSITALSVTGFPYVTYRVQVPVDQIAWQASTLVSAGNPNLAVRRNFVPNEFNNDAYSEVPGAVTDSISLVPPTLSDGTFYVTVYSTNTYSCSLQSGNPVVTDIDFTSMTLNDDPNRAGWRYFRITDLNEQLGSLGWDLFLQNFAPGTRIGLRRNAVPSSWNFRNNGNSSSLGSYDILSSADFLQHPAHQADVWYVGVFNPNTALGPFTLVAQPLTAQPMGFDADSQSRANIPPGKWQFFQFTVPSGTLGWDLRFSQVSSGSPRLVIRRDQLPTGLQTVTTSGGGWSPGNNFTFPSGYQWKPDVDWTRRNLAADGVTDETGRILAMGMGEPLEPGTYYAGVIDQAGTNAMTYTLSSRGIGPGFSVPVTDLDFNGGTITTNLPGREAAYYRVQVPTNAPSWKVRLAATNGDAMLIVLTNHVPNIDSGRGTYGKLMQKIDNEHYLLLPPLGKTFIPGGVYYLAVVSEGVGPVSNNRMGSGSSTYTLSSLSPLPIVNLGILSSVSGDLTLADSLEGGEVKAYTFSTDPDSLAMEIRLENRVGIPVEVATPGTVLPDPSQSSPVVSLDSYGTEGGGPGAAAPDLITCANCGGGIYTLMVKARGSGLVYSNATYTIRIHSVSVDPLAFDGLDGTGTGMATVTNQSWGTFRYWRVTVPTNALGWDIRLKDVSGTGIPHMVIQRDGLPGQWATTFAGQPGNFLTWPSGIQWAAHDDWTRRSSSANGLTNETGRLLEMGIGRPLQPGSYVVGVLNDTITTSATTSYTIWSRGIGSAFTIPVTDLDFKGGVATNAALGPREAAYYRVQIPDGEPSWQVSLSTNAGEVMLLVLSNSVPNVDSGQFAVVGKFMHKPGNETYVLLPTNNPAQSTLPGGTYYLAVVSEGLNATNISRIGTSNSSFTIQSLGPMPLVDMGGVSVSSDLISSVTNQDAGSTRGFQFSVPPGISSLEVHLDNRVGNPVMVVRLGAEIPDPSIAYSGGPADDYGSEGGYAVTLVGTNAGAGTTLVTLPNPPSGTYSIAVKARSSSGIYSNANYTVRVTALSFTDLSFDGTGGGSCPPSGVAVSNQLAGTWRYFRVQVPTNILGWDLRLNNVSSNGAPRIVVRRDILPNSLVTATWGLPGTFTNWPSGNQWAPFTDWTSRQNSPANVTEAYRILAMGINQPLEPGTYYIGVNNSGVATNLAYSIVSRGIGDGLCLPVLDLPVSGGAITNTGLAPREAAYYRIHIPSNTPSLKLRVTSLAGEVMLVVLTNKVPCIDSGHSGVPGKLMQKAGNEHYILLPPAGQNFLTPGVLYLAVVSEGINPPSSNQTGTGNSSYIIACEGQVPILNLGTAGALDLVRADTLQGGESKAYQFTVAQPMTLEVRLDNRVGNPVMVLRNGPQLPYPGQSSGAFSPDDYGNEAGQFASQVAGSNIPLPSQTNGIYTIVVKARISSGQYPDANYTLRIRQVPIIDLNFSSAQNTNGLSNVAAGLLADNQRAYYRVVVPATNRGHAVLGWRLDLSQSTGQSWARARQNLLPDDAVASLMPFTPATSVLAPPFLTNGTWYVEVRGSNSTAFNLVSEEVTLERPAWAMPGTGQPSTTPGLVFPNFGDTGVETNGVPLTGDQGTDLAQGSYDFYGVNVPATNNGIMRLQLTAISGNPDVYIRTGFVPTLSHRSDGQSGTLYDRSLASSVTEYGNFVPLIGRNEFELAPGPWYIAVRAAGNANARYRLRLSAGNIQDLSFSSGTATGIVAGSDWFYYRLRLPENAPTNIWVTFNQLAGDVVMYIRDTVPPGNGSSVSDIRDWSSDLKNSGPYLNYDAPGTYLLSSPQLRPGSVYYLGFKAVNDAVFSISNNAVGGTLPLYPIIDFYNGSVTNVLPANSEVTYRIFAPRDATRWRHSATHVAGVKLYLENGFLPLKTSADDWQSAVANSSLNQYMLSGWPWVPNADYFLTITNTTGVAQPYSFVMSGQNALTDDNDADGMLDAWERQYFNGSTAPTAAGDFDNDGVSNLNEFLEGTNPADSTSLRPRVNIAATNGIVVVNPFASNYTYGASVTLTATPNPGYLFLGWSLPAFGTVNPLSLTLTSTITMSAIFKAPGDDFAQRIPINGWSNTVTGFNTNATREPGEPNHAGNVGGRSVWWTWTAVSSGNVTITTAGSSFNTLLAIYTGTAVTNLTLVATNDNDGTNLTSRVTFSAVGGVAYAIAVDGTNGSSGNIVLQVQQEAQPVILGPGTRLPNGSFQFTISAQPGYNYNIEASTNLTSWALIATLPNPTGLIQFTDPNAAQFSTRMYRATRPLVAAPGWILLGSSRSGNQFSFTLTGPTGQVVRIESSTNLLNWATIATLTNAAGSLPYTDPGASNVSRFYRAVSP